MAAPQRQHLLRFDKFEVDLRAGELRKSGFKLRLQGQPLQVLTILLQNAGSVLTREELRTQLWPSNTFVDFDHSLNNAIGRIREVLEDSAETPRYIETLPRRGYRFIAQVDEVKSELANSPLVRSPHSSLREIQSLAVLPLQDHSGGGHDYFADGMTEALITSLAKIKALRVISRTSAMQYKGVSKSLLQIGRELHVDAVIEGSVLRSGDRVRITVQLIEAKSDQHLWAESYERDFREILRLQSEIARQVAMEVRIILTPEEQIWLETARQVIPEAHDLYLKARHYWNGRTEESVKKALSCFHSAIDKDPTFAQGYAGLADCYNILGYYNALRPIEAYPVGKAAALRALELDSSLAEPHATLGVVKRDFEWDWQGAEEEFRRAIELNPGYVEAYHWRGTLFSMLGQHGEAIREKIKALEIDPLSVIIKTDLGRMYYFAREYDCAIGHFQAALNLDAKFVFAHIWLGHVYEQQGRFEEALAELKTGIDLSDESAYALARLGLGYGLAGKPDEARAVLKKLESSAEQRYVSAYDLALVHLGLQERNEALRYLEHAFEQRSLWLGYLKVEPYLDPLRSEDRFEKLLYGGLKLPGVKSSRPASSDRRFPG